MTVPEPSLTPPELPIPPLRCCLCRQPVPDALGLHYGPVCRRCLQDYVRHHSIDDLSALLCAEILTDEPYTKEVPNL